MPNINDFVAGFKILLKPGGTATFEFPHILEMIRNSQFDTIYHEHYSYLSLSRLSRYLHVMDLALSILIGCRPTEDLCGSTSGIPNRRNS